MARSWEDVIEKNKRKKKPYEDDVTQSRNIDFTPEPWQEVLIRNGAEPSKFMDPYAKKEYGRPYYDFGIDQEQNKTVQNVYDTMVRPAAPLNHKQSFTPKPTRPVENATLTNIPTSPQKIKDTFKTQQPIKPLPINPIKTQQIKDTFKTQPIYREPVAQDMASQLKAMTPQQRMTEFEYQTGAKRPQVDPKNAHELVGKYPYAPYNQGELTATPELVQKDINLKRGIKDKTKAFLHGLANPIAKPIQRFFDDGMKDENGLYPNDGSSYKRTYNWYVENEMKLLEKGYNKKDIKAMRKQDLKAARLEDERLQFNAAMGKRRDYQPTTGDEIAKMGGEVTSTLAQALAMGAGMGAAGITGIKGAALVGAGTEAVSSYGDRDDIMTAAKDVARNALFYGAGKYGSDKVGAVAGELITKYGLDTNIAVLYATEAIKGLTFDAAGYAATLPTYPLTGDQTPTGKEVAMDMLVGALFDFIPNAFDVKGTHEANLNAEKMQKVVRGIKYNYDAVAEYERNAPNDTETIGKMYGAILNDIGYIRENINSTEIRGQEQTITMLNELFERTEKYIYSRMGMDTEPQVNQYTDSTFRFDEMNKRLGYTEPIQKQATEYIPQEQKNIESYQPKLLEYTKYPTLEEQVAHSKQRHQEILEEYNKRGASTEPRPPIPRPQTSEKPIQYGTSGNKAFKKWGTNEWVNADLNNMDNPYTQDYKRFFETWYEAGRLGIPTYMVRYEGENNFPPFLENAFYQAGKNDMEKGTPKQGTGLPKPKTQELLNPITVPLKNEEEIEVPKVEPTNNKILESMKAYDIPEDFKDPNYKGEYVPFGPKGSELIGTNPENTKPYFDGVMGKMYDKMAYGIDDNTARGLYAAGERDREHLNYREMTTINQYLNTKGQLQRLMSMGLGDKPVADEFKGELHKLREVYDKLNPKTFKFKKETIKEDAAAPIEETTGYIPGKQYPTKEEINKSLERDIRYLQIDGDEPNAIATGIEKLKRKYLKKDEYNHKAERKIVEDFFKDNYSRIVAYAKANRGKGEITVQELYNIQKPYIIKYLTNRKVIKAAAKTKDVQKARYEISQLLTHTEIEYLPNVHKEFNDAYRADKEWLHKEYRKDIMYETLRKLGFTDGEIKKSEEAKDKDPEGYEKVKDFSTLKVHDVVYHLTGNKLTENQVLEVNEMLGKYEVVLLDNVGKKSFYYTGVNTIYKKIEQSSIDRVEDRKEQVKKNLEAEEAATKEVVEMTREEYETLKTSYDEAGIPFPDDIEVKIVEPEAEQEAAPTLEDKKTLEAYEQETKKLLGSNQEAAYNYIRGMKKNGYAATYYMSPELAGVDELRSIRQFISFVQNKSAAKLDTMQMEMANEFPEVGELGLEEFAQYLVDSVKYHRESLKAKTMEQKTRRDLLEENEEIHRMITDLEEEAIKKKINLKGVYELHGRARESYSKNKIEENTKKATEIYNRIKEHIANQSKVSEQKTSKIAEAAAIFEQNKMGIIDGLIENEKKLASIKELGKTTKYNEHEYNSKAKIKNHVQSQVTLLYGTDYIKTLSYVEKKEFDKWLEDTINDTTNAIHDYIFKDNTGLVEDIDRPFDNQDVKAKKDIAPSRQLAEDILKYIDSKQEFSPNKLYELADKAFGGTQASGTYEIKDAYDAMELAVNLWLKKDADYLVDDTTVAHAVKNIKTLEGILKRLPTQTKRSERTESYQQFSTPPTVAYLASYAANMTDTDIVLEPSAGIGGLAVFGDRQGAKVVTNELEPTRLEVLKEMGFETHNVNAEQINNLLPDSVKPTVVLMNPPFSAAPERMKDKTATANAKRHIEQALERLEDGGRLVAIVGEGMADDRPAFKEWFNELRQEYQIRANLSLNKTAFNKYGTNFGTQLIVIDKTGPQLGKTLTGKYENLTDIPKVLEGIRNDRRAVEQKTTKPGSEETPKTTRPNGAISTTGDGTGTTNLDTTTTKQPGTRTDTKGGETKPTDTTKGMGNDDSTTRANSNATDTHKNTKGAEGGSVSTNDREQSDGTVKATNRATKKKIENEDDVYSTYEPSKLSIEGAKPHMSDLVESAAMAAVDPPDVTYTPHLPQKLIESGALSLAQLENIVYAGQSHAQLLPDGKRKGHFNGDGTGVGKGRQIVGIIMDNMNQGRKKAVWFTKNQKLVNDAYRDWTELGNSKETMYTHSKIKAGDKISINEGVLVSTYGMLKSGAKNNPKATRINQIVEWLGKDFDGVIVFDEAHEMSNAIESGEGLSKKKASQTGLAGIDLQDLLPNARIEYVTATGAMDVHNLAYLTRLGLWGQGTAFKNVNDFISSVGSGGLAAMELVARDMKAMGVYLSRSISFKGVEYDTLEHELTPMQTEIYDTMSEAWSIVLDNVEDALQITGANKNSNAQRAAKSQFYNAIQKFYNQIITAMSMPSVMGDIKKELAKGNSCVIQIVNTNEAAAERQFEKMADQDLELDELDLTPRDTLVQYLTNSFPVHEYEDYEDDNGNVRSRPVLDAAGNPVISKKLVKKRDELINMIEQMSVPDGPLEMLLDEFGPDMVAEVTGRKRRVVSVKDKQGNKVRKIEKRTDKHSLADVEAFQGLKKRILIFSDAGGTGASYHADRRVKNTQHRIHYLLQPGWNVFKATQGLGRTHRTNQVSAPTFRLVTTNVMGQKRFTSTIARRLDQLGALTKGQRQAGSGIFGEKDNLESSVAKDALAVFYKELYKLKGRGIFKSLGLEKKMLNEYGAYAPDKAAERDTSLFLNRILALKVAEQNEVFGLYMGVFDKVFNKAIEDGTLDMGLENVKADKIEVNQEAVIREQDGIQTKYVQMTVYKKPKIVEYKQLKKLLKNFKGVAIDNRTGDVKALYTAASTTNNKGEVVARYVTQGAMREKRSVLVESTIDENFVMLPENEWESAWVEEIGKQPEYIDEKLHMLTGTLLPIWDRLPQSNTSVKRVMTEDGETYLGRVIQEKEIDGVLRNFQLEAKKESYTREQLMDLVLNKDKILVLAGGDKLKVERKRVSNEWRLEVTGRNLYYYTRNFPGIIHEKIQYKDRYFIPTGTKGLEIIEKLTKQYPVLEVKNKAVNEETDAFTSVKGQPHTTLGKATGENKDVEGTKSASQIFKEFSKAYKVPIKGRPNRGTLGTHYGKQHMIRVKKANDIPVLTHEVGHLLDKIHQFSKSHKAPYAKELEKLGENTSRPKYAPIKKRREGVAEFIRLYMTQHEEAKKLGFYEHFVNTLSKDQLDTVNRLRDEIWKLTNLTPEDRVGKSIKFYDAASEKEHFDFEKLVRTIKTQLVDETYPVEWAAGILGGEAAEENMKHNLAQFRGYEGIALNDLDPKVKGLKQTNLNGRPVGDSYGTIIAPVQTSKKKREAFMKYQVARRMEDYHNRELEMPDTIENYRDTVARLEETYPEFKEVFSKLLKYRQNELHLLVEGGLITEKKFKEILEKNPNYTPSKRDIEGYRYATGDSKKLGGNKGVIKKLKGGGQDIIDPQVNDIFNTFAYRSAAMRNKMLMKLAALEEKAEGAGFIMSKTRLKMQMFELSQEQLNNIVLAGLRKLGWDTESIDVDLEVMNKVFKPQYVAGPNQVLIYVDGSPKLYDVNPELYEALSGLHANQVNILIELLSKVSNVSKTGIISTPQYLYRNFGRDTLQNLIGSQAGINVLDIAAGFVSVMRNDESYQMYQRQGGAFNFINASDMDFVKDTIKEIDRSHSTAKRAAYRLMHPLKTFQDMIAPIEQAGRLAEFKKLLKQHGNSDEAIARAIHAGRDLSVDFKRGGALIRKLQIGRIVNFFKPQVQGIAKDISLLTNKKTRMTTIIRTLAYMTVPTMLLWWINKDNEKYQELPQWRKDMFFNIPIGDPKTTELFFMFPKVYGLGSIFSALPERLAEKYVRDNPRAFDEYMSTLAQAWGLPFIPSAIEPIIQVYGNQNWLGNPIINMGDKQQWPHMQYNQYTSEAAKTIARITKDIPGLPDAVKSPKMIEHLIVGYTGTVGRMAIDTIDMVVGRKDRNPLKTIGIGFVIDADRKPYSIDKFYEYKEVLDKDYAEWKLTGHMPKAFDPGMQKLFSKVNSEVSDIRKKVEAIEKLPESQKKTELLLEMRELEVNLMKAAASIYEQKYR